MKILYILSTGLMGGVERHVQCIAKTLKRNWEQECVSCKHDEEKNSVRVLIIGELGPVGSAMLADGIDVVAFGCSSGHDWRIIGRLRKLMHEWRPTVVCMQGLIFLPTLYFKLLDRNTPLVRSIHTPTEQKWRDGFRWKLMSWLGKRFDWHLPVSGPTWEAFQSVYPWSKGRGTVFYNPLRVTDLPLKSGGNLSMQRIPKVVGMVGRLADQKDWPSFIEVCRLIYKKKPDVEFWAIGDGPMLADMKMLANTKGVPIRWFGQRTDAKELIGQMDVFVMTSKHEQLPTTVLEAFGMRTAICGFIPVGGVTDILSYSDGSGEAKEISGIRDVFIKERDVGHLAQIVLELLECPAKRGKLEEEGHKILTSHFMAEKTVPEELLRILRDVVSDKQKKQGGMIV